jgi:flagellar hook protein FlgE
MQPSSNTLDFAITGEGFFVIRGSDGAYYYTRNGAFTLDADGYLVTANGDYVMGVMGNADDVKNGMPLYDVDGNPIFDRIKIIGSIPTGETDIDGNPIYETYTDYAVDSNGAVTAINSIGEVLTIGRLVLATFNNTGGLEKAGNSYYSVTSNSGEAEIHFVNDGCGAIKSGYLEMSNVDLATELTNMIITQRGYQVNSRVITTSDAMLEELINLKR